MSHDARESLRKKAKVVRRFYQDREVVRAPTALSIDGKAMLVRADAPPYLAIAPLDAPDDLASLETEHPVRDATFLGERRVAYLRSVEPEWNGAVELLVRSLDAPRGDVVYRYASSTQFTVLRADATGARLTFNPRVAVEVWDALRATRLRAFPTEHVYGGRSTISRDGKVLALSGQGSGRIELRCADTGDLLETFVDDGLDHGWDFDLSPDGTRLVGIASSPNSGRQWLAAWHRGRTEPVWTAPKEVGITIPFSLALSPDGRWVVVGSSDREVLILDAERADVLWRKNVMKRIAGRVLFAPDSRRAIVAPSVYPSPTIELALFGARG